MSRAIMRMKSFHERGSVCRANYLNNLLLARNGLGEVLIQTIQWKGGAHDL